MTDAHYSRLLQYCHDICRSLERLERKVEFMSPALQALADQVTAITTERQAVLALLQSLADKLAAAAGSGDADAIAKLSAELKQDADAMASAVLANTPSAPPPDPTPAPVPTATAVDTAPKTA